MGDNSTDKFKNILSFGQKINSMKKKNKNKNYNTDNESYHNRKKDFISSTTNINEKLARLIRISPKKEKENNGNGNNYIINKTKDKKIVCMITLIAFFIALYQMIFLVLL